MFSYKNIKYFENSHDALNFMEKATELDNMFNKSRKYTLVEIANGYLVEIIERGC